MAVDYDLVVIGSSWAGIYAATKAIQLQARVALVTQIESDKYLPDDLLFNQSLAEIGCFDYRQNYDSLLNTETIPKIAEYKADNWLKITKNTVQSINSLTNLAALGVDIIAGKGEFYRLPQLGLQVKQRKLRSRNFLLATGTNFVPNFLESNVCQDYLTLRDLPAKSLVDLPHNIIIVGSDPTALELAQGLVRLNKQITLVVPQSRILPQEDLDISTLVQAQLEAEGIEVYTNSTVSQIKVIDRQKWLQAGDRALPADEIIIADCRQPNIKGLNLTGVGVEYNRQRVFVNQKLQTSNPRIYACGDLIGGYYLSNITRYEINLILKNTLFINRYKVNYHAVPWAVYTQPNLARVGLNEKQAKQKYAADFLVVKQHFSTVEQAQILNKTTGFCKLLVRQNGEIIGCSIIGDRAIELIVIPTFTIQHQIKLDANPMRGLTSLSIPTIYPSMTEILTQASNNFYQQKLQQNSRLSNRLKTWFSLRKG